MAAKYGKYFIEGIRPGAEKSPLDVIADLDGDMIKGSLRYFVHWMPKSPKAIWGADAWGKNSHGPHVHKSAEILIHIGTNPDDPFDLGAEIELCMGPEMERHTITKSCLVYIPPNLVHCPWTIKRVDRPFIMVQVNQEPTHSEKSMKHLVSPEEQEKMMFIDQGYESQEIVTQFPKGAPRG